MSHFVVWVFGEDPDNQLAPFHEFECTGVDDEFVVDVDVTSQYLKEWEEANSGSQDQDSHGHLRLVGPETKSFQEFLEDENISQGGKYTRYVISPEGEIKVIRRTNPNAKWDWYTVGGRWDRSLQLRGGKKVNQATLAELDLESILAQRALEAGSEWDRWHEVLQTHPVPKQWNDFISAVNRGEMEIEEARTQYHTQPAIQAWYALGFWEDPVREYSGDRDIYVENDKWMRTLPFALVHERTWCGRGDMGWFGAVSDEKDPASWVKAVKDLLEKIPPDTTITVVDCHI